MPVGKSGAKWCGAPGCGSNSVDNPNLSFFRFPKDPKRLAVWIDNSSRHDLKKTAPLHPYKNVKLCSNHFEASAFISSQKENAKRLLKQNANPTLFVSSEISPLSSISATHFDIDRGVQVLSSTPASCRSFPAEIDKENVPASDGNVSSHNLKMPFKYSTPELQSPNSTARAEPSLLKNNYSTSVLGSTPVTSRITQVEINKETANNGNVSSHTFKIPAKFSTPELQSANSTALAKLPLLKTINSTLVLGSTPVSSRIVQAKIEKENTPANSGHVPSDNFKISASFSTPKLQRANPIACAKPLLLKIRNPTHVLGSTPVSGRTTQVEINKENVPANNGNISSHTFKIPAKFSTPELQSANSTALAKLPLLKNINSTLILGSTPVSRSNIPAEIDKKNVSNRNLKVPAKFSPMEQPPSKKRKSASNSPLTVAVNASFQPIATSTVNRISSQYDFSRKRKLSFNTECSAPKKDSNSAMFSASPLEMSLDNLTDHPCVIQCASARSDCINQSMSSVNDAQSRDSGFDSLLSPAEVTSPMLTRKTFKDAATQTEAQLTDNTPRKKTLKKDVKNLQDKVRYRDGVLESFRNEEKKTETMKKLDAFDKLCNSFLAAPLCNIMKEQARLSQVKTAKGRRYSLDLKKFALAVLYTSPKAFRLLRTIMLLPYVRCLHKLTEKWNFKPGFNDKIFAVLKTKVASLAEDRRICNLNGDEVSMKANLFYDHSRDEIVGLHDIGAVKSFRTASHALILMAAGILDKWKQPIAFFFVGNNTSAFDLKEIIETGIKKLSEIGLRVMGFTSDQGGNFSKCAKLLGVTNTDPFFMVGNEKVFYIFDFPHLMKSFRNNLMKYIFEYNGKKADWQHLVTFYNIDKLLTMRLAPKLTDSHIAPNNFEKMKVRYATQVFSHTVSAALYAYVSFNGLSNAALPLAELLEKGDKLFDILNSSSFKPKKKYNQPFRGKKYQVDFLNDMLEFFKNLQLTKKADGKDVTNKMKFIKGFEQSIRAVLDIWSQFQEKGHAYLFTRRLSQDCLENFFALLRSIIGFGRNLTPIQVQRGFKKLFSISYFVKPINSNCEEDFSKTLAILNETDFTLLNSNSDDSGRIINENTKKVPSASEKATQKQGNTAAAGKKSVKKTGQGAGEKAATRKETGEEAEKSDVGKKTSQTIEKVPATDLKTGEEAKKLPSASEKTTQKPGNTAAAGKKSVKKAATRKKTGEGAERSDVGKKTSQTIEKVPSADLKTGEEAKKLPDVSEKTSQTPASKSLKDCVPEKQEFKIGCKDYMNLKIPYENGLSYVSGYLLDKCLEKHTCSVCESYAAKCDELLKRNYFTHFKAYNPGVNLFGKLNNPEEEFLCFVNFMEETILNNMSIFAVHKPAAQFIASVNEYKFQHPCKEFPYDFLVRLFIRLRIFYVLDDNNKAFKEKAQQSREAKKTKKQVQSDKLLNLKHL